MNLNIKLLSEIEKNGASNLFNVSPFMSWNFPIVSPHIDSTRLNEEKQEATAKNFLKNLRDLEYIDFEGLEENIYYHHQYDEPTQKWFTNTDFYVTMTVKGYNYLLQHKLNESTIELNNASLSNYKRHNRYSFYSIIIAVLSVIVAIGSFFRDRNNGTEITKLQLRLDQMQKEQKLQQAKEEPISNPKKPHKQ